VQKTSYNNKYDNKLQLTTITNSNVEYAKQESCCLKGDLYRYV
jgi:hypothetical protein